MRFHVLGIPHTITRDDYSACAFTQKVLKFCKMMHRRGHTVYHYGHKDSIVECTEHISVTDNTTLEKAYGHYNWRTDFFKHDSGDHAHLTFNLRAAEQVSVRKQAGDFLLLFWGHGHSHIAACHANDLIVVEPGIGSHNNVLAPFAVFESYAVMHYVYGKYNIQPRFYDCVVPNYFDINDFIDASSITIKNPFRLDLYGDEWGLNATSTKLKKILDLPDGYVLVIARLISTKGIQIAVEACLHLNLKLVIAGQGQLKDCVSELLIDKMGHNLEHIGYVEPAERSILFAKAKCLMLPTLYAEPFGGASVEAQISGIPVITTDWGAFAETVKHGVSGYRCRTLEQFIWALKNVDSLDRKRIRSDAIANYSLTKVATMYEEYFSMLQTVKFGSGFYDVSKERLGLSWLEKK